MLFAGRALAGFGNANLAVAQAVVSDVTTAENRAKGMGMLGAAFGLGFIIGPIIGGFASRWGLHAPAFVAGALGVFNWLLALAWLQETHPPEKRSLPAEVRRAPWNEALRVPGVGRMLAIGFLLTTGFALFEQVLSLFVAEVWAKGGTEATPGEMPMAVRLTVYFLITIGLTGAIVQGGLIGRIGKRFAARSIAAVGMALMALGVLGIPLVQSLPFAALIGVGFVLAVGSGLTNPTLMGMLSNLAPAQKRGSILGVGQAANSLGRVVGPAVAGTLFEYSPRLPFFIGATLVSLCLVILLAGPAVASEEGS
jgi:DHA1 family tetracycline resistance protein-like MFS transporter